MIRPGRLTTSLLLIAAVLPALFLFSLIFLYSVNIPHEDGLFTPGMLLSKTANGLLTLEDLCRQGNESRLFFSRLLFIAIAWTSHWDVRFQMIASFLIVCITSFNIYCISRITLNVGNAFRLMLLAMANLLLFGPVQETNWLWGNQTMLFIPAACLTGALAACCSSMSVKYKTLLAVVLSTIATFSFANGMLCWVLLLPVVFVQIRNTDLKSRALLPAFLVSAALNLILYFRNFQTPESSTSLYYALLNPIKSLRYFFDFLGTPICWFWNNTGNVLIGIILFLIFCGCGLYMWRHKRKNGLLQQSMPWAAIAGYALLTGCVITLGRVGYGTGLNLPTRYTTFALYMPVSLFFLVYMVYRDITHNHPQKTSTIRAAIYLLLAVFIIGHCLTSYRGITRMKISRQVRLGERACYAFMNLLPSHNEFVNHPMITRHFVQIMLDIPTFRSDDFWRHPYFMDPDIRSIQASGLDASLSCGMIEDLRKTDEVNYSISGRARLSWKNEPANAVLLTYTDNESRAILFEYTVGPFAPKPGQTEHIEQWDYTSDEWQMSFSSAPLPPGEVEISAWAYDALSGKAYPLENRLQLNEH